MTAQVKNQDPLNSTDPTDYATQLTTFTQVEQQIKSNKLLEKMVSSANLGAATLIEKTLGLRKKVILMKPQSACRSISITRPPERH